MYLKSCIALQERLLNLNVLNIALSLTLTAGAVAFTCFSIHAISTATAYCCSSPVSCLPAGIWCHLKKQPRQQQPVACWAMNTGCPLIGVCLPSLGIYESPIHINGYQTLALQMLCFPWVVGWVRSQGWQPDNSSKDWWCWRSRRGDRQVSGYQEPYSASYRRLSMEPIRSLR